ncbi:hypothetical protein DICSQDRAFT_104042 [Dichomitus squalens LYAD-421 SS1]|uniref:uncharacterized protein n=1 Tax=Dichomitus squalens (strain LYAD-421) TaxID=732165 RepID=UPI00044113D8|nr:uncharacterized protein DICSQDRAFT_104042 [Dichomitus squalens LYAD-421 SS1]EJF62598.1 hypothetical protein DICSQDRAFT_104042 [Dichomitus squalens LYAD-421 SS1]
MSSASASAASGAAAVIPHLPPLDKMFLIGIWVETVLYGINILVYGSAIYVLVGRIGGTTKSSSHLLISVSTLAFMLSTAYIAVTLRQLLEAFIYSPPGTATLYFANESSRLAQSKLGLYTVNVFLQDLILIWRLWTLFGRRFYVVILPLILELVRLAASITAMVRGGQPGVPIFDPLIHKMGIVDWTFDLALNIGVTLAIAARLWYMGRTVSDYVSSGTGVGSRGNKYNKVIFTIIESGGLFATATLVTVSLYLSGNIATVVAIDSITQLATITPLLIIVRVGLGLTHGSTFGGRRGESTTALGTAQSTIPGGPMTFAPRQVQISVSKVHDSDTMVDEYPLSSMHSGDLKYGGAAV